MTRLCVIAGVMLTAFAPPPQAAPTAATRAANAAMAERLDLANQSDFRDARRGKLAEIPGGIIRSADGSIAWDASRFGFLRGEAPGSVNPSLWRQSQLLAEHGLFEVTGGIYQIRGYDLANMTLIAGDTGWIVVDPLLSVDTARAGLQLANDRLGARPVSAILFTHSHADHFGGVAGLNADADVPVYAPHGFTRAAVSENLLAGPYMQRRSALMFGNSLPAGATGQVGVGLGPGLADGPNSLAAVTHEIPVTGEALMIDGVPFEFMDAGETEAPAEFIFFLPDQKALMMSEVASGTFHNALTLRGAEVRDTLSWSKVIDMALQRFGPRADLVLASHHWPTWGRDNVATYLENQRDIYRYVHDQTVRRANRGETMHEIAEDLPEPDFATRDFSVRGYYGTLQHNAKAVYQRYFGWWDGVPARFNPLPPAEESERYIDALGGEDRVLALGEAAFAGGEYRWAATLFNHLVFAGKGGDDAKGWLAAAYEQLGFQAESGAWRDYYLSGAQELRQGPGPQRAAVGSAAFLAAVPTADLFDALAVRYAPERSARTGHAIQFVFPDRDERLALLVRDSVLIPRFGFSAPDPVATLTIDRGDYDLLILRQTALPGLIAAGKARISGDPAALASLFAALDAPPESIAIVTP